MVKQSRVLVAGHIETTDFLETICLQLTIGLDTPRSSQRGGVTRPTDYS